MLLWLSAAAIPLVIHWLTRRRQVEVAWAAIQLLQQVLEQESKRIRLEQLVLLVVRTTILVLLGLAVARPFFNAPQDSSAQTQIQRIPA